MTTVHDSESSGSPTPPPRRFRRALGRYVFEFASVFLAVFMAFALDNYATERRERRAEARILTDIKQGLAKDLVDLEGNILGHRFGLAAVDYFRRYATGREVPLDSFPAYYFMVTRDFINAQNTAGYENLKSRGLELIRDDSLRNSIVSLYEYDYALIQKLEEEYAEQQFFANHHRDIDRLLASRLRFDESGQTLSLLANPGALPAAERKDLLLILRSIEGNRQFILQYYGQLEARVREVMEML